MLSALVAERWQGREIFIDRDPTYFGKVLNYLRDGGYVVLPEDDNSLKCLEREAEIFYNLPGLVDICSAKLQVLSDVAAHWKRNEELFIDRNPDQFAQVLDYLRDYERFDPPVDSFARNRLRKEAEFYKLPGLVDICSTPLWRVGDTVNWRENGIDLYWEYLMQPRTPALERLSSLQCVGCRSHYHFARTDEKWSGCENLSTGEIRHRMLSTKGEITAVQDRCCYVRWDIGAADHWDTHVPKFFLRLTPRFYNIPGLATMCLPDVIGYGDSVQWKISAIDTYWKSFVRFQYYGRRQAKCMACGSNVYGYVGPTTEANGMVMVDGKVMNKVLLINYAEWLPLKHHMKVIKGYVLQLNSTCCRVKWGRDLETHLPKSALRLVMSR
ncbi:unnamed protein product [Cylicocyclus nassatus]|uniref:Potassium channel tetramerisation-type BTB domain-containing protein n=1 Tax=Cylicocyclus nassatus TaxID=53992 RepID=A0AA36DSF7_CYLNA|nr:unnamed protein product [Cylicocyclus nassatus]